VKNKVIEYSSIVQDSTEHFFSLERRFSCQ